MVRHDPRTSDWPSDYEFPDNSQRYDGCHPDPELLEWEPHTHTIDVKNLKITFHNGSDCHYTFKIRPRSNGKSLKLEMTNDEDERIGYGWEDNNTLFFPKGVYLDFSSSSNIDEMEEVFRSHKWEKVIPLSSSDSDSGSDSNGGASNGGKKFKKKKTKKQKVTKNKKTRKRNVRCK